MTRADLPASVLERRAVVYVRQSSAAQVHDNLESQRRQYALADLARAYGFRDVVTIDDDLGRSASGVVTRPGFDALVAQLCQGVIGAVFCLEASRLARNGREWHHLLEMCGLVGARVVDADGAYDPALPNDRLLLGLKGTISEFELTLMRRRLVDGAQAKAQRGEYRIAVPIGYVWARDTGALELDPDRRVQEAIRVVFRLFARFRSARRVQLHMTRARLLFPRPSDGKRATAARRWLVPVYRNVLSVLQNPCYAGAYAFGRTTHRTQLVDGRLAKTYGHARPMAAWPVLLRDHHPGFITWAEFEANQQCLHRNAHRAKAGAAKAARGGHALLSGLLRCRRCGRMLLVQYTGHTPRHPRYVCRRGDVVVGTARCVSVGASRPDDVVAGEVLRVVAPDAVAAALTAMDLARQTHDDQRRALELEREQAGYDARLAQRRYEAVDPDNRLVAAELEARWNAALTHARACDARLAALATPAAEALPDRAALMRLAGDLRAAWDAPTADPALKQRLVRALVEEIVVDVDDATREVVLVIHWKGGVHSEVRARKPASGEHRCRTSAAAAALIRDRAGVESDAQIAAALTARGERTGQGHAWTATRVRAYRQTAGIAAYASAARDSGWLTMRGAAARLGVPDTVVRRLVERGLLPARQVVPDAPWQIRVDDLATPAVQHALRTRRTARRVPRHTANGPKPAVAKTAKR